MPEIIASRNMQVAPPTSGRLSKNGKGLLGSKAEQRLWREMLRLPGEKPPRGPRRSAAAKFFTKHPDKHFHVAEATAHDVANYGGWPDGITIEAAIKAYKTKTKRFIRLSRFAAWQAHYSRRHECSFCWEASHVLYCVLPVSDKCADDLKHAASDAASSAFVEWLEDVWFEELFDAGYKVWVEPYPLCIRAWGWPS
jgi:hypothetical protein